MDPSTLAQLKLIAHTVSKKFTIEEKRTSRRLTLTRYSKQLSCIRNSARGLMQVTKGSRKILGDEKGELKEHFLTVTRADLNDPNINICAGVRWLFHKRKLVSSRSNREATWEEVIYSYKGCSTVEPSRAKVLMDEFSKKLQELQKCGRK